MQRKRTPQSNHRKSFPGHFPPPPGLQTIYQSLPPSCKTFHPGTRPHTHTTHILHTPFNPPLTAHLTPPPPIFIHLLPFPFSLLPSSPSHLFLQRFEFPSPSPLQKRLLSGSICDPVCEPPRENLRVMFSNREMKREREITNKVVKRKEGRIRRKSEGERKSEERRVMTDEYPSSLF